MTFFCEAFFRVFFPCTQLHFLIAINYSLSKVISKSLLDKLQKSALKWHIACMSSNSSETVLKRLTSKICLQNNKVTVLIQFWIVVLQYAGIMHAVL